MSLTKTTFQLLYRYVRWMYIYCYCRHFEVRGKDRLDASRPTLYITTHQNNLPDALSIACALNHAPHFVARADFFKRRWANAVLRFLQILPIQRKDHGKKEILENLPITMQSLQYHLESGGSCVIMPEGSSFPNRSLRPLKKGWARLLLSVQHVHQIQVVPVAIEYSNWNDWGPDVRVTFGEPLDVSFSAKDRLAIQLKELNQRATQRLTQLISSDQQIEEWSEKVRKQREPLDFAFKWLAAPILLFVLIFNAPIHWLAKNRVRAHSRKDFKSTLEIGYIGLGTPLWFLLLGIGVGVDVGWEEAAYGALILPVILWVAARSFIAWKHS